MSFKYTSGTIALTLGIAGLLGVLMPASVSADAISDFYRNKRVTIIQGSAPGGGYDMYARTLARHLPKHIPGHPRILVQNKPGAGGKTPRSEDVRRISAAATPRRAWP